MLRTRSLQHLRRWLGWLILLIILPACAISGVLPTEEPAPTNTPTLPPTFTPLPQPTATPQPSVTPLADNEGARDGDRHDNEGGGFADDNQGNEGAGDEDSESGGESGGESSQEEGGGDTNEPASSASAPTNYGAQVYTTDFQRGWPDETYEGYGTLKRADGGYVLDVSFQALWTGTTVVYRNTFYAELEATPRACVAGQAWYGMIFSWRDNDHFRAFVVTCSNRWSMFERNSNNRALQIGAGELPSGVDASTGTHKLAVNVNDNVATLWLDDFRLTQAGLTDMPVGDIGPYAETTGAAVNVLFTRLTVYEAGSGE